MKTIATEMGFIEVMPKHKIFTENIELLRHGQYHLAGQLVAWSITNGGPGLTCLSSQMIHLMCKVSERPFCCCSADTRRHAGWCLNCADERLTMDVVVKVCRREDMVQHDQGGRISVGFASTKGWTW